MESVHDYFIRPSPKRNEKYISGSVKKKSQNSSKSEANNLATPKNKKNKKTYKFECDTCNYKTNYHTTFKRHAIKHKEKSYFCVSCNFGTNNKKVYIFHMMGHSSLNSSFKCGRCDNVVESRAERHICKLIKCTECHFSALNKKDYHMHVTQDCPARAGSKIKLEIGADELQCSDQKDCLMHVTQDCPARANPMIKLEIGADKLECSECDFSATTKIDYDQHVTQHQTSKPKKKVGIVLSKILECSKCSFKTRSQGSLKLHSSIHNYEPLSCSDCDYTTNFSNLLTLHKQSHHAAKVKQFKCDDCDYTTTRKCSLQRHSLVHSKVKSYECSQCPFKTTRLDSLKIHSTKRHASVEDKENLQNRNLDSSEAKLGVKSEPGNSKDKFMCSICAYEAPSRNLLKDHILLRHNNFELVISNVSVPKVSSKSTSKSKTSKGAQKEKKKKSDTSNIKVEMPSLPRRYTHWSIEDKKEIYWCHTYAKHDCFERLGGGERRRLMLLERAIVSREKICKTPDSRFHSIITNVKLGRTCVTVDEIGKIENSVNEYLMRNGPMKLS